MKGKRSCEERPGQYQRRDAIPRDGASLHSYTSSNLSRFTLNAVDVTSLHRQKDAAKLIASTADSAVLVKWVVEKKRKKSIYSI